MLLDDFAHHAPQKLIRELHLDLPLVRSQGGARKAIKLGDIVPLDRVMFLLVHRHARDDAIRRAELFLV